MGFEEDMIFNASTELSPHFINTRYFREAAIDFKKNKGRYTLAPIGSKEWYEYWEEQERRCRFGYKVGGVKITGKHYGYMNFSRMKRVGENNKGAVVSHKEMDFPGFWEIDYDWWWYKEIAWYGCTKAQLDKLKLWRNPKENRDKEGNLLGTHGGGKHLSCLKTRRGGFSYKEAYDGVHNYNFIPGSISYYFAAIEQYLTTDGILNKVAVNLEWLNQFTDGFWLKNRMEKNTLMHQKASYKDDYGAVKGFLSEIVGVIINDPDKVRGKDGIKLTYEEAGSFKNLKKALGISVPSVGEGATLTGQISVFGTGGEEKGQDIEGLEDVFLNPILHNMLMFENDWEQGYEGTECGVFIPCYMANPSFMDSDGNVQRELALTYEDEIRATKRNSGDSKDFDLRIAEHPKVPTEALLRPNNNGFPKAEMLLQKNRILRSKELMGRIQHGMVRNIPGKGLDFCIEEGLKPITKYPHKNEDDIRGCFTMIERPQKCKIIVDGKEIERTPEGVYYIVVDPYYKDQPKGDQEHVSLGAIYVIKMRSMYFTNKVDLDVAWFVGRPGITTNFHEILFNIADFYNAKIQGEIGGGGQGIVDYARAHRKLDRLEFEPLYINEKEIEKISKNRSYLMDLQDDQKRLGLTYWADWLKTVVGIDENGHEIWNLHYIYDLGLLDEGRQFNDKGNFDRISAQIIKMFVIREHIAKRIKEKPKEQKGNLFGKRPLFQNGTSNPHGLMMMNEII